MRWSSVALVTLLALSTACGGSSGDGSGATPVADGTTAPTTTMTSPDEFVAAGFDSVRLRVFDEDGIECGLCSWQADTNQERARGLMEVGDLGGAFAMVFTYEEPTETAFWMKNTLIPLTIVYYDGDGVYLGAQDMEPCPDGEECTIYDPPAPFVHAVEVLQGTAEELGLEPGSTIAIGGPCTPDPALVEQMLAEQVPGQQIVGV